MWPMIDAKVPPDDFRRDFVRDLIQYFLRCDVDPIDLVGFHPDIDSALRELGELPESTHY
jgi:hypothetical protein